MREIGDLLGGGREPVELGVGEHGVEHHQAVRDTARRDWAPIRTVGLVYGSVQRDVVHVIEPAAIVPARVRRRVLSGDQLVEKGARLLSVHDAGEGRILA